VDGWDLARERVAALESFVDDAHALGVATGAVHLDLRRALPTQVLGATELGELADRLHWRLDQAESAVPELAPISSALHERIRTLGHLGRPIAVQRVHGDYHLGQVLHSPDRGWVLLDFEGEPLRPLSERSLPDQWVRDVAGMLRSFDYVGGTREQSGGSSARDWVTSAQQAFLDGYAARAGQDPRSLGALLAAFELDKAMYEVVYEARNRPGWVAIPLGAVRRLTAHFSQDPTTQGDPS
jgi:1,4-alpha-glucan branching enzyme